MNPTNIKIVFIAAICAVLWGGFNIAKATYTRFAWDRVDGVVLDFEKNVWSCGKGIGECYNLIIGYNAKKKPFTINSKKQWNYNPPTHLLNKNVPIYYSPLNPADAVVGSDYGSMNYGIIMFFIGTIVLFGFWIVHKRNQ